MKPPSGGLSRRIVLTAGPTAALTATGIVARPTWTVAQTGRGVARTRADAGASLVDMPTATEDKAPRTAQESQQFPGMSPFVPRFPFRGLVTYEYARRHPGAIDARLSPDWIVTSGSLLGYWGCAWSGVPDGLTPDPASRLYTGSAVLRVVSARQDFGDVTVEGRFLLRPPLETPSTPAADWDGGHLWLRYRSPEELYALSFCRRDGTVALKRKAPPAGAAEGTGGLYTTLVQTDAPLRHDTWHHIAAQAATTATGTVQLRLRVNGRTVAQVEDTTPGALAGPGAVGVRGDNTELLFYGFLALPSPGWFHGPAPGTDLVPH